MTINDLNDWIEQNPTPVNIDESSDEEEDDTHVFVEERKIKHVDAVNYIDNVLKWGKQNNIDLDRLTPLRELQKDAIEMSLKIPKTQTAINVFFK